MYKWNEKINFRFYEYKKKIELSNSNVEALFSIRDIKSTLLEDLGFDDSISIKDSIAYAFFGLIFFGPYGLLAGGIPLFCKLIEKIVFSKEKQFIRNLQKFQTQFLEKFESKKRMFIIRIYEEESQIKKAYKFILVLLI